MFLRDVRRLALFLVPTVIVLYTFGSFWRHSDNLSTQAVEWLQHSSFTPHQEGVYNEGDAKIPIDEVIYSSVDQIPSDDEQNPPPIDSSDTIIDISDDVSVPAQPQDTSPEDFTVDPNFDSPRLQHIELSSISTTSGAYFPIDFSGTLNGANPNIIPHPSLPETYIVVAQLAQPESSDNIDFIELTCLATFTPSRLACLELASALPIAPTSGENCHGQLDYFNVNNGPHDARVFHGPDKPYVMFGSNSGFTCFGLFMQNFRGLMDWGEPSEGTFSAATEVQRPPPWGAIEKNWFVFWDAFGEAYLHYDVFPRRTFAKLSNDGSVGEDLSLATQDDDSRCIDAWMPKMATEPTPESIHQATNSLRITLCQRADPYCVEEENTFIMSIYQHKTFFGFHSVYEPYVMLLNERAPFGLHAMGKRPLWINGREKDQEKKTSDMFYVTSISWKGKEMKYHGYLDDEMFIGFGIEDERAGGIDVRAEDVLRDLGFCLDLAQDAL